MSKSSEVKTHGIGRRDFLKISGEFIAGAVIVSTQISNLETFSQTTISLLDVWFGRPEEPKITTDTKIPVVENGITVQLIKYDKANLWKLKDIHNGEQIPMLSQYILDEGIFNGNQIMLAHDQREPDNTWSDQEAVTMTRALIKGMLVNQKFFYADEPAVGPIFRNTTSLMVNKGIATGMRPDAAAGFRNLGWHDLLFINITPGMSSPNSDLIGTTTAELNHKLNLLVDFHVVDNSNPNGSLLPSLVEGMGEYADFLAVGRWRLTQTSKDRLTQSINSQTKFYDGQLADHITLAGMTIAEAEERWPGVWAHMGQRLATDLTKANGGTNGVDNILSKGQNPTASLEQYLKYGDEISPDFSAWFRQQQIFFIK